MDNPEKKPVPAPVTSRSAFLLPGLILIVIACGFLGFVGVKLARLLEPDSPAGKAALLLEKAEDAREDGNSNRALRYTEEATQYYSLQKDRAGLMQAVLSKALTLQAKGDKAAAETLFRQAVDVARKLQDATLEAQAAEAAQAFFLQTGKTQEALLYASYAANSYVRSGQWRRGAGLMIALGDTLQENNSTLADRAYNFALDMYQKGRDLGFIALASARIATLYKNTDKQKAFFYYDQALQMHGLNGNLAGVEAMRKAISDLDIPLPVPE